MLARSKQVLLTHFPYSGINLAFEKDAIKYIQGGKRNKFVVPSLEAKNRVFWMWLFWIDVLVWHKWRAF